MVPMMPVMLIGGPPPPPPVVLPVSSCPPLPSGEELTTVMLRNIPNKITRLKLMEGLNQQGFKGQYDYLYLPLDRENRCNMGYAFVNFTRSQYADQFFAQFNQRLATDCLPGSLRSEKVCEVCYARIQGREGNLDRFRKLTAAAAAAAAAAASTTRA